MFNSHKFLANTIWRKEKDKAIFHTGSSALQVRASEADTFPPFNTFLKKKKKLKPNNLKKTPLIPNSFDAATLFIREFDVNTGNWTYSFNPQILRKKPVIALVQTYI